MTPAEFLSQFRNPDPRFGPVPAWWWSGDKLDWPRMRWQMDRMHEMGIRNLVIINLAPGGTMFGSEPDDPPFLSEAWWGYFRKTCDRAAELGMKIWFYDQIGFSGANFQADIVAAEPKFAAQQLKRVSVEGEGTVQITCPGAGTPIAAYLVPADAPAGVRYVSVSGRSAEARGVGKCRLNLVYRVNQGFDLLSPEACQKLLDTVHRQFERRLPEHIGKTIVGSFQDELPELPTWGATFAESFKQRHGYDIIGVIHRLFEEGDDASRATRVHYHGHRAALGERAFFKPFFDWHESWGMSCAFDQQSPAREARILGCTHKYADYTRVHQWYAAPGCDLHGNGKLHSSIALLHDRKRVWLEGFHSTGWGGTLADTFDWLLPYLQSGSNLYNPHAIYYSTRMGWWEWAPPSTCWRQPYARHYPAFADMIARLCKLLTAGVHQASIGVLFPTATVQSALGPVDPFPEAKLADQTLHEVIGSMRWHQVKTGPLDEMAIDYHLLDEPAIAAAEVRDGAIVVKGVRLRALVLPHTTMLDDATAEVLAKFAEAGGRLVAVGVRVLTTLGGRRFDVAGMPNGVVVPSAEQLKAALPDVPREVHAPVPFLHRRAGEIDVLLLPAVTGMATVVKWPSWFEPIEHTTIVHDRYLNGAQVTLPPGVGSVTRFDPLTGESSSVAASQGAHETVLNIDFDGAPFVVLAFARDGKAGSPPASSPKRTETALGELWDLQYLPTLPTEFVDTHDPARPELRFPRTEELRWLEGDGVDPTHPLPEAAARVRTGFGPRGWKRVAGGAVDPVVYSTEFGIEQDKLHINTLGPKGHVPEEFIDLGKLCAGQPATVSFGVTSEAAREAMLIVGANASKSARVNGASLGRCEDAYQWIVPASLRPGANHIELELSVAKDAAVRMSWCLADPAAEETCARPERILAPDAPSFGTKLVYFASFEARQPLVEGRVKVSVAALARVYVGDTLLGLQGGCDPYRPNMRGNIYTLPPLPAGVHTIKVELLDPGGRAAVMVDLLAKDAAGNRITLRSDAGWQVRRDDAPPANVVVHLKPEAENAAWSLYRRPHPLPWTRWIEGDRPTPVLDLPLVPPLPQPRVQWFEWITPPGATGMTVPLTGDANPRIWIDSVEQTGDLLGEVQTRGNEGGKAEAGSGGSDSPSSPVRCAMHVRLSNPRASRALLRVESRELGGGAFAGPVTYQFADGVIRTGSWLAQGLRSYSGAVRMTQTLRLDNPGGKSLTLDLGRVRGTVEALLNGERCGVRFMSPYRFNLTPHARTGENTLKLIVTNTLVNHQSTWSPSSWWSPDQLECGVLGPVRVVKAG